MQRALVREIHVIPQKAESSIHDFSIDCDCSPFIEMVSYLFRDQEETFYFHNLFLPTEDKQMQAELDALREHVKKLEDQSSSMQRTVREQSGRITDAVNYLEFIGTDRLLTSNEQILINVVLDKLRG